MKGSNLSVDDILRCVRTRMRTDMIDRWMYSSKIKIRKRHESRHEEKS